MNQFISNLNSKPFVMLFCTLCTLIFSLSSCDNKDDVDPFPRNQTLGRLGGELADDLFKLYNIEDRENISSRVVFQFEKLDTIARTLTTLRDTLVFFGLKDQHIWMKGVSANTKETYFEYTSKEVIDTMYVQDMGYGDVLKIRLADVSIYPYDYASDPSKHCLFHVCVSYFDGEKGVGYNRDFSLFMNNNKPTLVDGKPIGQCFDDAYICGIVSDKGNAAYIRGGDTCYACTFAGEKLCTFGYGSLEYAGHDRVYNNILFDGLYETQVALSRDYRFWFITEDILCSNYYICNDWHNFYDGDEQYFMYGGVYVGFYIRKLSNDFTEQEFYESRSFFDGIALESKEPKNILTILENINGKVLYKLERINYQGEKCDTTFWFDFTKY